MFSNPPPDLTKYHSAYRKSSARCGMQTKISQNRQGHAPIFLYLNFMGHIVLQNGRQIYAEITSEIYHIGHSIKHEIEENQWLFTLY